MKTIPFYVMLVFFMHLVSAQNETPKEIPASEILEKADAACKRIKRIEYEISFSQDSRAVTARVFQEKDEVKNIGLGESKFIAEGEITSPDKNTNFKFSYDGTYFKFQEGDKQVVTIENPDATAVGRTLGLDYYMVVMNPYGSNSGMELITNRAEHVEYQGIQKIKGKKAFQLSLSQIFKNRASNQMVQSTSEWFFDTETFLPIGYIGNRGVTVKEIAIIDINHAKTHHFDINKGQDVKEKRITGKEPKTESLLTKGETFPNFDLKDFKGGNYDNTIFKNHKVTVIDFWGTWCGPCKLAMPELQALYDTYHSKGLNIIGISVMDKPKRPQAFVEAKGYSYQFLENGDMLAKGLQLDTFPTIFIVDSIGKVIHAEKGIRDGSKADFEAIIKKEIRD